MGTLVSPMHGAAMAMPVANCCSAQTGFVVQEEMLSIVNDNYKVSRMRITRIGFKDPGNRC